MDKRRSRGWWALWTAVLLTAFVVAYPLSMGPIYRAATRVGFPSRSTLNAVYWPVHETLGQLPLWVRNPYLRYLNWWNPPPWCPPP